MLPRFERPVWLRLGALPDAGDRLRPLLALESAEFEAVLGQPLCFSRNPADLEHDVWNVIVDPSVPYSKLESDLVARRLVLTLASAAEVSDGLNLLHTLAYSPSTAVRNDDAASYAAAFDRIYDEVANIYPAFDLRGLDWAEITDRYRHVRDLAGPDFWTGAEEWVAELGDAHTQLISRAPRYHPPYIAEMRHCCAVLRHVPSNSDAWQAGVRPGDRVDVDDPSWWLRTVGASPQQHTFVAGRRFLSMSSETREYSAAGPTGSRRTWTEHRRDRSSVVSSGNVVTIRAFTPDVPDRLREALQEIRSEETLTIDLRANSGGNLVAAAEARRLFLRDSGVFGAVVFTTGRGSVAKPASLSTTPASDAWPGDVRILVDAMTYPASEDFLHPLVGLDHVTIIGGPTGGGSGRPHSRPIKDGVRLATSTAITYTRDGHPIEYQGIQPTAQRRATRR